MENRIVARLKGRTFRARHVYPQIIRLTCALLFASLLTVNPVETAMPSASAAVTNVQNAGVIDGPSGTTVSIAFSSANTAGNTIVAAIGWDRLPGATPLCRDDAGNKYTTIAVSYDTGNSQHLAVCYANNIAAFSDNDVFVDFAGTSDFHRLTISEYSGIADSYPIDTVATNKATATLAADNVTSGTATTTSDGDLIFGAVSSATGDTTMTPGAGFTIRQSLNSTEMMVQDRTQTTAGAVASTATFTHTRVYTAIMVAFRSQGHTALTAPLRADGDGLLVYSESNQSPQWRSYQGAGNTFGGTGPLTGTPATNLIIRTSPNKREAVAAWTDNGDVLQVACYDGFAWSHEFARAIGGVGATRRFDVAYETTTGDAMIMYSNNSATNSLVWQSKPGTSGCGQTSSWSAEALINPAQQSGIVQWVKLAADRRKNSNLITAIFADAASDLDALVFSGSAWANEPAAALETALEVASGAQDVDSFDIAYESNGDVMVAWGAGNGTATVNGAYYAVCTGGTSACTWGAKTQIGTATGDDATNLDISANPNTDEIVFASVGNAGDDLQIAYWSGSAWTMTPDVDTAVQAPVAGTRLVAAGWLTSGATTRSIVAFNDAGATNINYYAGTTSTFTLQSVGTATFASPQKWYEIEQDPIQKDRLMFTSSDGSSDVWAKRLTMTSAPAFTWSASDGGTALGTSLTQATTAPFAFAHWRSPGLASGTFSQERSIFENDDGGGNPDNNTAMAANNTAITGVAKGERLNARFQLTNGSRGFDSNVGLFYDRNDGYWSRVMQSAPIPITTGAACDGDSKWLCGDVDTGMNNYQWEHGMAIDKLGRPWISYYNRVNGTSYSLKVATYVGASGNCGTSNAWSCTVVYSNGSSNADDGRRSNIAIDKDNNVWVVFSGATGAYVATNKAGGGCGTAGSADWTCTQVTSNVLQSAEVPMGLAISPTTGKPAMSYVTSSAGGIFVATYVGSGGDCTSPAWTGCVTHVDVGWGSIAYSPIGELWLAYDELTTSRLKVAQYVGSGGSCADTKWNCSLIDNTAPSGEWATITFGGDGSAWIAHRNNSTQLHLAHYIGTGGGSAAGCGTGSSTAWECIVADTTAGSGGYLSLAIAPDGSPWVVHYNAGLYDLRLTRYVGSGGGGSSAGCGSGSDARLHCSVIAATGDAGNFPVIGFAQDGTAWIAHGHDTAYDLRFARLNRGGEILSSPSAGTTNNAPITTSHGDMTTATDSSNRNDADCVSGTWANGKAFQGDTGRLTMGAGQCTEVTFTIDTSQATAGTTYRFIVASENPTSDTRSMWRGPSAIASGSYASLTVEAATTVRISKDSLGGLGSDCVTATWTCTPIEVATNAGAQSAIAVAPDGTPWMAYNVVDDLSLKVAKYVGEGNGGNTCGAGGSNAWSCQTLEQSAGHSYGYNTLAMAIDARGNPWISYYDANASYQDLYVARYVGTSGTGCTTGITDWTCYQVATTGDAGSSNAIALDANGRPWVSFYELNGNGKLAVAQFVGDDVSVANNACSGTAGNKWSCKYITTASDQGRYSSIAIDGINNPWISYRNTTAATVAVARYVGVGGTGCGTNVIDWSCTTIDAAGFQTALAFDSGTSAWLTYNNASGQQIVAHFVGSSGTGCSGSAAWTCGIVDTNVPTTGGITPGLAIDSQGRPWVSYKDQTNSKRKVARYLGTATGNCGSGNWASMFSCEDVSPTTGTYGSNSGIAFDGSGTPWVSNYRSDNLDLSVSKLKLSPNPPSYTVRTVPFNGRNARSGDLRYHLDFGKSPRSEAGSCSSNVDAEGYCATATNDTNYDSITARTKEAPAYVVAMRSASNASYPAYTFRGISSVATWTQGVTVEVYRFGTTNAWVPLTAAVPHAAAGTEWNTQLSVTSGTQSHYWEIDGSNYWSYFRVSQAGSNSGTTTLKTNYAGATIANNTPGAPVSPVQFRLDGTTAIAQGATTTETSVIVGGTITDAQGEVVNVCVEVKPLATAFDGLGVVCSQGAFASGTVASATVGGLAAGNYHWRGYSIDPGGLTSAWTQYNSGGLAFVVAPNTAPSVPATLAQKTTGDVVLSTGGWHNSTSIKFTADLSDTDNPDTLSLCVEAVAIGSPFTNTETNCGSTVNYVGTGLAASVTLTLSAGTEYHWQARTKDTGGLYSTWVAYGGNSDVVTAARDIGIDTTAPTTTLIYDGTAEDTDAMFNDGSLSQLSANWDAFTDGASGIDHYSYQIGTTVGGVDIKALTSVGTSLDVTATGLSLRTTQLYYFRITAFDAAGNTTTADTNGQLVAPTLTFTLDTNALMFDDVNASSSYTDSETLQITTSTNGYGGYVIRQSTSALLTSGSNTIVAFNGGSYASPDTWQAGDLGFGYTSADTLVQGANKFQSATCPGGTAIAAPGCFAPMTTSTSGDIVADHPASIQGTPVTGETFNLTYRLTTNALQPAGVYTSTITLAAVVTF